MSPGLLLVEVALPAAGLRLGVVLGVLRRGEGLEVLLDESNFFNACASSDTETFPERSESILCDTLLLSGRTEHAPRRDL